MLAVLAVAALALRAGLVLRRRRLRGEPPKPGLLAAHLRLARPAVLLMGVGLVGGPASSWWLRGWTPLETVHGWLGVLAVLLFGSAGLLGLRLQRGQLRREKGAPLHGLLGALGMLVAGVAAAAGMVLLP